MIGNKRDRADPAHRSRHHGGGHACGQRRRGLPFFHQALEIKVLEKQYPDITRLVKDRQGSFVLPDIPEEEVERLIAECEKELGS